MRTGASTSKLTPGFHSEDLILFQVNFRANQDAVSDIRREREASCRPPTPTTIAAMQARAAGGMTSRSGEFLLFLFFCLAADVLG